LESQRGKMLKAIKNNTTTNTPIKCITKYCALCTPCRVVSKHAHMTSEYN